MKTKSGFYPPKLRFDWKIASQNHFFTKNLICSYGPSAHFGCSTLPYRPKKNQDFTFLVVLFDRAM